MINKTNQVWEVGSKVNVGFMKGLLVVAKVPTPGNYEPDAYLMMSEKQALYSFVPHKGLTRINTIEAKDMIAHASEMITIQRIDIIA